MAVLVRLLFVNSTDFLLVFQNESNEEKEMPPNDTLTPTLNTENIKASIPLPSELEAEKRLLIEEATRLSEQFPQEAPTWRIKLQALKQLKLNPLATRTKIDELIVLLHPVREKIVALEHHKASLLEQTKTLPPSQKEGLSPLITKVRWPSKKEIRFLEEDMNQLRLALEHLKASSVLNFPLSEALLLSQASLCKTTKEALAEISSLTDVLILIDPQKIPELEQIRAALTKAHQTCNGYQRDHALSLFDDFKMNILAEPSKPGP